MRSFRDVLLLLDLEPDNLRKLGDEVHYFQTELRLNKWTKGSEVGHAQGSAAVLTELGIPEDEALHCGAVHVHRASKEKRFSEDHLKDKEQLISVHHSERIACLSLVVALLRKGLEPPTMPGLALLTDSLNPASSTTYKFFLDIRRELVKNDVGAKAMVMFEALTAKEIPKFFKEIPARLTAWADHILTEQKLLVQIMFFASVDDTTALTQEDEAFGELGGHTHSENTLFTLLRTLHGVGWGQSHPLSVHASPLGKEALEMMVCVGVMAVADVLHFPTVLAMSEHPNAEQALNAHPLARLWKTGELDCRFNEFDRVPGSVIALLQLFQSHLLNFVMENNIQCNNKKPQDEIMPCGASFGANRRSAFSLFAYLANGDERPSMSRHDLDNLLHYKRVLRDISLATMHSCFFSNELFPKLHEAPSIMGETRALWIAAHHASPYLCAQFWAGEGKGNRRPSIFDDALQRFPGEAEPLLSLLAALTSVHQHATPCHSVPEWMVGHMKFSARAVTMYLKSMNHYAAPAEHLLPFLPIPTEGERPAWRLTGTCRVEGLDPRVLLQANIKVVECDGYSFREINRAAQPTDIVLFSKAGLWSPWRFLLRKLSAAASEPGLLVGSVELNAISILHRVSIVDSQLMLGIDASQTQNAAPSSALLSPLLLPGPQPTSRPFSFLLNSPPQLSHPMPQRASALLPSNGGVVSPGGRTFMSPISGEGRRSGGLFPSTPLRTPSAGAFASSSISRENVSVDVTLMLFKIFSALPTDALLPASKTSSGGGNVAPAVAITGTPHKHHANVLGSPHSVTSSRGVATGGGGGGALATPAGTRPAGGGGEIPSSNSAVKRLSQTNAFLTLVTATIGCLAAAAECDPERFVDHLMRRGEALQADVIFSPKTPVGGFAAACRSLFDKAEVLHRRYPVVLGLLHIIVSLVGHCGNPTRIDSTELRTKKEAGCREVGGLLRVVQSLGVSFPSWQYANRTDEAVVARWFCQAWSTAFACPRPPHLPGGINATLRRLALHLFFADRSALEAVLMIISGHDALRAAWENHHQNAEAVRNAMVWALKTLGGLLVALDCEPLEAQLYSQYQHRVQQPGSPGTPTTQELQGMLASVALTSPSPTPSRQPSRQTSASGHAIPGSPNKRRDRMSTSSSSHSLIPGGSPSKSARKGVMVTAGESFALIRQGHPAQGQGQALGPQTPKMEKVAAQPPLVITQTINPAMVAQALMEFLSRHLLRLAKLYTLRDVEVSAAIFRLMATCASLGFVGPQFGVLLPSIVHDLRACKEALSASAPLELQLSFLELLEAIAKHHPVVAARLFRPPADHQGLLFALGEVAHHTSEDMSEPTTKTVAQRVFQTISSLAESAAELIPLFAKVPTPPKSSVLESLMRVLQSDALTNSKDDVCKLEKIYLTTTGDPHYPHTHHQTGESQRQRRLSMTSSQNDDDSQGEDEELVEEAAEEAEQEKREAEEAEETERAEREIERVVGVAVELRLCSLAFRTLAVALLSGVDDEKLRNALQSLRPSLSALVKEFCKSTDSEGTNVNFDKLCEDAWLDPNALLTACPTEVTRLNLGTKCKVEVANAVVLQWRQRSAQAWSSLTRVCLERLPGSTTFSGSSPMLSSSRAMSSIHTPVRGHPSHPSALSMAWEAITAVSETLETEPHAPLQCKLELSSILLTALATNPNAIGSGKYTFAGTQELKRGDYVLVLQSGAIGGGVVVDPTTPNVSVKLEKRRSVRLGRRRSSLGNSEKDQVEGEGEVQFPVEQLVAFNLPPPSLRGSLASTGGGASGGRLEVSLAIAHTLLAVAIRIAITFTKAGGLEGKVQCMVVLKRVVGVLENVLAHPANPPPPNKPANCDGMRWCLIRLLGVCGSWHCRREPSLLPNALQLVSLLLKLILHGWSDRTEIEDAKVAVEETEASRGDEKIWEEVWATLSELHQYCAERLALPTTNTIDKDTSTKLLLCILDHFSVVSQKPLGGKALLKLNVCGYLAQGRARAAPSTTTTMTSSPALNQSQPQLPDPTKESDHELWCASLALIGRILGTTKTTNASSPMLTLLPESVAYFWQVMCGRVVTGVSDQTNSIARLKEHVETTNILYELALRQWQQYQYGGGTAAQAALSSSKRESPIKEAKEATAPSSAHTQQKKALAPRDFRAAALAQAKASASSASSSSSASSASSSLASPQAASAPSLPTSPPPILAVVPLPGVARGQELFEGCMKLAARYSKLLLPSSSLDRARAFLPLLPLPNSTAPHQPTTTGTSTDKTPKKPVQKPTSQEGDATVVELLCCVLRNVVRAATLFQLPICTQLQPSVSLLMDDMLKPVALPESSSSSSSVATTTHTARCYVDLLVEAMSAAEHYLKQRGAVEIHGDGASVTGGTIRMSPGAITAAAARATGTAGAWHLLAAVQTALRQQSVLLDELRDMPRKEREQQSGQSRPRQPRVYEVLLKLKHALSAINHYHHDNPRRRLSTY